MNNGDQVQDRDRDETTEGVVDAGAAAGASRGWVGWLMSGSFHAVLLLLMWCIYWVIRPPEVEVPGVRTQMEPAQKTPEVPLKRTIDPQVEIQVPVDAEVVAPVATLDVEVEPEQTPNDLPTASAQGDPMDVAQSEMGGPGLTGAIGVGGPPMGKYGQRKGGHKRAVSQGGGGPRSERAVNAALRWFKNHQSPNGKWDTVGYYRNCTDNPKCEPGIVDHCSVEGSDVAMTGYALYCFLGAGYDHKTGQYKKVVKKGLDYLLSVQKADGYLGDRNYENAIATMALCQAYAMSEDPALKGPAQRGVDQILAHENQEAAGASTGYGTGLGWDYVGPSNRNDSSVTGWNVMALKSALIAGLDVKNGLDSSKHWLETVWKKQNPDWSRLDEYKGETRFPYTYMTDTGATEIAPAPGPGQPAPNATDLTCVGTMCAVFLGHRAGDRMLESLSNYVINHQIPASFPCNAYYLYYNTLSMFQCGGQKWKTWNGKVRDMLVNAQRSDKGCFDGSWDYGNTSFTGAEYGRILTTAYCTLCLEVYYLYDQNEGDLSKHL